MPPDLELIVNVNQELTEAGRGGELGRLRALLAGGADASARNEYGSTPLHAAASWNDRRMAELLLDHGADVHARDWEGDTPLHIAAAFGDKAVLGLLLDRGADVNVCDDTGWTPLHLAARLGRVEEVGFLLSRGAEAGARDRQGRTPLDVALSNDFLEDRREPLKRLLGVGPPVPSPAELMQSRSATMADGMPTPEEWRKLAAEWTHDYGLRHMEDRGVRYEDQAVKPETEPTPLPSPADLVERAGPQPLSRRPDGHTPRHTL